MNFFSKRYLGLFQKVCNYIFISTTTSDFFYLMLEFMNLLIHWVWVGAVMDITPSLVGIMMEPTIIDSFPKIPVMQLVVQMIT